VARRPSRPAWNSKTAEMTDEQRADAEAAGELMNIDTDLSFDRIRQPPARWLIKFDVEVVADPTMADWRLWAAAAQAIMQTLEDYDGFNPPRAN
jgi:hypothetical protein